MMLIDIQVLEQEFFTDEETYNHFVSFLKDKGFSVDEERNPDDWAELMSRCFGWVYATSARLVLRRIGVCYEDGTVIEPEVFPTKEVGTHRSSRRPKLRA